MSDYATEVCKCPIYNCVFNQFDIYSTKKLFFRAIFLSRHLLQVCVWPGDFLLRPMYHLPQSGQRYSRNPHIFPVFRPIVFISYA